MDDNKVAVLLEDLISKFRTFGEGLDGLKDELQQFREETNHRFDKIELQNRQEHMQLMQMVKEVDREVQVEIKRVK
jgi:Sec-independent protein translocase protein TatA